MYLLIAILMNDTYFSLDFFELSLEKNCKSYFLKYGKNILRAFYLPNISIKLSNNRSICIYPYIYLSYLSFYLLSIYLGTSEKKRKLADEAYDLTDDNFTHDDDVPDKLSTFRYMREGIKKNCIPP